MNRKITSEVLAQGRLTDCKSNGRKQFSSSISRIFENSGQVYGTIAIIIYDFKQVLPIGGPFCLKYIIRIIPESLRLSFQKAPRKGPTVLSLRDKAFLWSQVPKPLQGRARKRSANTRGIPRKFQERFRYTPTVLRSSLPTNKWSWYQYAPERFIFSKGCLIEEYLRKEKKKISYKLRTRASSSHNDSPYFIEGSPSKRKKEKKIERENYRKRARTREKRALV